MWPLGWSDGRNEAKEYGIETLVMDEGSREDMEQYICQRVEDKLLEIHHGGQPDCAIRKWTAIAEGRAMTLAPSFAPLLR